MPEHTAHHHNAIVVLEDVPTRFSWTKMAKFFGPGLLMCIAYVVRVNTSHRELMHTTV